MIEFVKWKYYSMLTWSKINDIKEFPSVNEFKIFSNKIIKDNDILHDINLLNKYNCDSYQKFISQKFK